MQLLVFAHRGEAQTFIRRKNLTASDPTQNLWSGENLLLLLTGEGPQKAMLSTAVALARNPKIERVMNFGVCGQLGPLKGVEIGDIIQAKQVYAYQYGAPQFQSFQLKTHPVFNQFDLVTASERVYSRGKAIEMLPLASLVDRELWGVARACREIGIDLESYKLVSDFVDGSDVCADIKGRAESYSNLLYQTYLFLENQTNKTPVSPERQEIEEFFFTTTQKRLFQEKIGKLKKLFPEQKEFHLGQIIDLKAIESLDVHPKQKTKILLEKIDQLINPDHFQLQKKLEKLTQPFSKNGVHIQLPNRLATSKVSLKIDLHNIEQWRGVKRQLEYLPIEQIYRLLEGNF